MNIHCIQHVSFEKLGNIKEWIDLHNHQLTYTKQYKAHQLPELKEVDFLIVLGGPMGVYDTDKYPWLKEELLFIQSAIKAGKVVLGICLGSQFIAAAMGAKVYPGKTKEIGWYPIQIHPDLNQQLFLFNSPTPTVFHWHGDTFDLPDEANLIASTNEVSQQAFILNSKVFGLQFHLEQTEETILAMLDNCGDELLEKGEKIQSAELIKNEKSHFQSNKNAMHNILNYLSKQII